ncbi:MAG: BON domain-containing protein [Candidatus Udaeobacter sp.]
MRKAQPANHILVFLMCTLFSAAFICDAFAFSKNGQEDRDRLIKQIRRELATLPYYGVFDWLEFELRPDNTVVLRGYVVRPTTKKDAEARIRKIPGVTGVVNEIEVAPVSPEDDRLRLALYRTIYDWDSPLFRYATQAIPSIHIIVKNGRAVLKGVVSSKADAQLAYTRARAVPGLFDVKSDLQVETEEAR